MFKYMKITFLVLTLWVCFISGCSDRGTNNSGIVTSEGGILVADHVYSDNDELILQIRNKYEQFFIKVYIPEVSIIGMEGGTPQPLPLLVLLAPQNGDNTYFFNHGLVDVANEMIAAGEIEPMAIACIPNDEVFGGYFYAGDETSMGAGKYDVLIGSSILDYLYYAIPYLIDSPDKRGIGGVGQGAYGAFRAAMKHPGQFSSISVTDGPMDFDGADGNSGLMSLFDDALMEQGLLNDPEAFLKFDSATDLANMFIGGALAFSPNDTTVWYTVTYREDSYGQQFNDIKIDSSLTITYYDTITIDTYFVCTDTDYVPGGPCSEWVLWDGTGDPDSAGLYDMEVFLNDSTYVPNVVTAGDGHNFDFHLPFRNNGAPYDLIWDMWLENNLENMLSGQLTGTRMWFGLSGSSRWNYHEQTQSWINTLQGAGYPLEIKNYQRYGEDEGTYKYVYDALRDILKFHDDGFRD